MEIIISIITVIISVILSGIVSFVMLIIKRTLTRKDIEKEDLKKYHYELSLIRDNLSKNLPLNMKQKEYITIINQLSNHFLTLYNHYNESLIKIEINEKEKIKHFINDFENDNWESILDRALKIKKILIKNIDLILQSINQNLGK